MTTNRAKDRLRTVEAWAKAVLGTVAAGTVGVKVVKAVKAGARGGHYNRQRCPLSGRPITT